MKSLGYLMVLECLVYWVDKYFVEERFGFFVIKFDEVVLVDVGGGFGQQVIVFKVKFFNFFGCVIV